MQNSSLIGNILKGFKKRLTKNKQSNTIFFQIGWLRTKILKHQNNGTLRKINIGNLQFYFRNPFEFLVTFQEIFTEGIYNCTLSQDPYIIDCGANIGISTMYFKYAYPGSRIISFEPDETNFEILKLNLETNNLQDIQIRKEAVWKEDTKLNFSNDANMASKIEMLDAKNSNIVDAISLDKFIDRKVDFLKMDIEGAEYEVMKSIKEKLNLIENMFIEYHGRFEQINELLEILEMIKKGGLKFYIKEATSVYDKPFLRTGTPNGYDIQLNIFCFRTN